MQLAELTAIDEYSCFYLSKRRQMQLQFINVSALSVVFTFQKEGRCNVTVSCNVSVLVVFTFQKEGRCNNYFRQYVTD